MAGRRAALTMLVFLVFTSCATVKDARLANRPAVSPALPPSPRVHFATASAKVKRRDHPALLANALWMIENPDAVVVLEGHCDERGSREYNLELGDRRARDVKERMTREGVEPGRVVTVISRGEENPMDTRHTPTAWRKNRRVEFIAR